MPAPDPRPFAACSVRRASQPNQDLRTNVCSGILRCGPAPCVTYDHQGLVLAASTDAGVVKLYDSRNYDQGPFDTFTVGAPPGPLLASLRFSLDGKQLLGAPPAPGPLCLVIVLLRRSFVVKHLRPAAGRLDTQRNSRDVLRCRFRSGWGRVSLRSRRIQRRKVRAPVAWRRMRTAGSTAPCVCELAQHGGISDSSLSHNRHFAPAFI